VVRGWRRLPPVVSVLLVFSTVVRAELCNGDCWGATKSFLDKLAEDRASISVRSTLLWVGWPLSADDAWLALDRNANGIIDSGAELFGNWTPLISGDRALNGYEALREFDVNGDGQIDGRDPVYSSLLLWRDINRNGMSESNELISLADARVRAISLDYRESRRRDRWGNEFRYRAEVLLDGGRSGSWDVFVVIKRPGEP
jgi:hypothetical protein